jgi:hypothetical protein
MFGGSTGMLCYGGKTGSYECIKICIYLFTKKYSCSGKILLYHHFVMFDFLLLLSGKMFEILVGPV